MDSDKRKALEAAGFSFGDAEDFLELDPADRLMLEVRVAVSRAIRRRREEQHLTQKQVAAKLKTTQPQFSKIEAGLSEVSLDAMFRGLFALGGSIEDLSGLRKSSAMPSRIRGSRSRTKSAE
jgi:predicted XRE-type DNA-binding protein